MIPVFHLNPKYMIVAMFPRVAPFVVARLPVEPWYADIATEKAWGAKTPDLLWVPAITVGVLRWLGFIGKATALAGMQLAKSQRETLSDLPDHIARILALNAKSELSIGEQRAINRLPADPTWIPEIEEAQAILGDLVRYDGARPWDGYKPRVVSHVVEAVKEKVKPEEKEKPGKRGSRGSERPGLM